ncbi:hypothetical protein F0L74_01250 [Chitinophaga agrisoli]|uniref:Uncharacterized protein n=1 Tax=Chitinophaga agrisoli TaxID=2607653 RepID=A0A5B2W1I0_9BACT|nr:hypothetical protein [Chitinophaga agrisoli]KAA2244630.1 hypothetical protein F0L74_01250 [Chitinophaga agrisoli]
MRSQIKIGKRAVESAVMLKGIGLALAVGAGVMGWLWRKKHTASMNMKENNTFPSRGHRWPQPATPVK